MSTREHNLPMLNARSGWIDWYNSIEDLAKRNEVWNIFDSGKKKYDKVSDRIDYTVCQEFKQHYLGKHEVRSKLVALSESIQPNAKDQRQDIRTEFEKLRKGPGNTSLDKWLGRWPSLVNSAKRYTIENLSEPQICEAFVEACQYINPPFYNYMKSKDAQSESQASVISQTAMVMKRVSDALITALNTISPEQASSGSTIMSGSSDANSDDAVDEVDAPAGRKHGRDPKTSDEEDGQPRRKREVIGSSSVSATQPSCLRDCVCGQAHKYADCWYLNPAKAPAKWRPQVHVQSEVITAISGSNRQREKIEKRYSRSKIALPDFWNSNNADDQSEKATSQASSATLTVGHVFECDFCDLAFYDSRDLEDHQQDEGHYGPRYECEACDEWYDTFARIKQHMNSHGHWRNHYCNDCNKGFENENNLQIHLNSRIHRGSNITCPFCKRGFATATGVTHHLETGSCSKARQLNRDTILAEVRRRDPNQLITKKLLTYPESGSSITATSASYNCDTLLYECYLCHKGFRELKSLNAHVNSPVHKEKVYHCPGRACAREFRALAALFNHLESESCGAVRFDAVQRN
ncbi:zf-C2H2-jaz domain containing protein, partial [Pyrenophora tritici-repentis]